MQIGNQVVHHKSNMNFDSDHSPMKQNKPKIIESSGGHIWERRYENNQTGWDRGTVSPALGHWLESGQLLPGRVLVPGCGHGHEIAAMIRAGCEVTAVDIAPTPVQRLKDSLQAEGLKAEVIQADLLRWEPDGTFDTVYEQTCLCALEPAVWAEYAARLRRWLKNNGVLYALFMQTGSEGGPPYHCELADMRSLFPQDAWHWLDSEPLRVSHRNGLHELGFRMRKK